MTDKKRLGRGLSALLGDVDLAPSAPEATLPIEEVHPNPDQPRRSFDEAALDELAESIRAQGIIQPIIVRPDPAGGHQIVAGERRWRAAQRAQLHEVPVVVRQLDDAAVLEIAIIENVQRTDLNPLEEAAGYRALMDRFGHTQEKLATALGKSRSHIANLLRLLNLPEPVQDAVRDGKISAGHARAILTANAPVTLLDKVLHGGWSVRQTEAAAKAQEKLLEPRPGKPEKDADTKALEADLGAQLGMKVSVSHGGRGGEVKIAYRDLDELDRLCGLLTR